MSAPDDDEPSDREADAPTPWHQSTAKVLGASLAGVAAIALIVAGVMFVSRDSGQAPDAPPDFVDPTFSSMTSRSTSASSTSTTTTRISPPLTTDLDLPPELAPPPPPPSESSSESSTPRGRSTTQQEETSEESAPRTTTRNRPRLNETRTLYPRP
ncbi:hypothetical protein [Mycobacterium sp. GA-2829]|uniref:hypothetical protein n=1 Tax=Mycobacterium sp. GA-2829 TaxID=1772283 RepID=UPI00073FD8C7|nr:hypothetical protein [Mycobacterium sp. GA-2829]KUI23621.1 hypothetical protein AU194_01810 [Mycobacterium sp. GA-2829]